MNKQAIKDLLVHRLKIKTVVKAYDGATLIDPVAKVFTGNVTGQVSGPVKGDTQVASADGAITIKSGVVVITKATAAALTLAAPTAGTDDGKVLWIDATTAAAHTVTIANGLRGAGAGADVGTFGVAIGNGLGLYAYNGAWYPIPGTTTGVTFA